jgi:hypothetical protein
MLILWGTEWAVREDGSTLQTDSEGCRLQRQARLPGTDRVLRMCASSMSSAPSQEGKTNMRITVRLPDDLGENVNRRTDNVSAYLRTSSQKKSSVKSGAEPAGSSWTWRVGARSIRTSTSKISNCAAPKTGPVPWPVSGRAARAIAALSRYEIPAEHVSR